MKKFIIVSTLVFSASPAFAQNAGDLTVTNQTSGANAAVFFVQLTTAGSTTPFTNPTQCLTPGQSAGIYPQNYGSFTVYTGSCTENGGKWAPSTSPTFTQASPSNSPTFNYTPYPYGSNLPPQYYYNISCSNSSSCNITSTAISQSQLDAKKIKERAK